MRFSGIIITVSTHVEVVIMMTYCGLNKKKKDRPQDIVFFGSSTDDIG
jgi:hypothetical protein